MGGSAARRCGIGNFEKMDIFCKKVEQKKDEALTPDGHNFLGKGPLGLKIVHKKEETELSPKTMVSVSEILLKTYIFNFFASQSPPRTLVEVKSFFQPRSGGWCRPPLKYPNFFEPFWQARGKHHSGHWKTKLDRKKAGGPHAGNERFEKGKASILQ